MHVLHVLDHSIPLQSGYTFRTRAILQEQRALDWKTTQVTGPKHNPGNAIPPVEQVDGFEFYRCQGSDSVFERLPVLGQLSVISALTKRLLEVARKVKPDLLHAHSPALNWVLGGCRGQSWHQP